MKKVLGAMIVYLLVMNANADCSITSVRSDEVSTQFKKYGAWSFDEVIFNQLCYKLKRAKARIRVQADAAVLSNKSIAWASLTVIDLETGISTSDFSTSYTKVSNDASQDVADELMVKAINQAAEDWTRIDDALEALEKERKKTRSLFGKK